MFMLSVSILGKYKDINCGNKEEISGVCKYEENKKYIVNNSFNNGN